MSNYLHPNMSEVATGQAPPPKRRRARWLVAGVAGLTGVVGLAAFTPAGVSGATGKSGSNTGTQLLADGSRGSGDDHGGQDPGGQDGKDHKKGDDHRDGRGDDFRSVPCNADELIAAIVRANADSGAKLRLAEKCTYTLNRSAPQPPVPFGAVGLPIITQHVVIDANGSTIVRAANATPFRILEVGAGGDLTLRDATIKGGLAEGGIGAGGGGIRVDIGGRATIENTDVVYNHTNGTGGGIANFGVTKILGGNDHDKDKKKDGGSNISNNSALYDGGGVYNNGNLTVQNTRLSYNNTIGVFSITPIGGAGGGLSNSSVAVLDKVHLDNNTAGFRGGGIRGGINSTTEARNVEVNDNRASSEGGGIFSDGVFQLKHGKIHHNEAGQRGGGVFNQIGQFVAEETRISENTASTNSTIEHGGGVYNGSGTVVLRRSHVDRNRAIGSNSQGGGIYNNATLTLTESKVTDNISILAPGGIFNDGGQVTVDQKTAITGNRPTNCVPSSPPVPNCFG
ncbi:right-handed parallel beta-helix repeat-containing protein [Micromonospora sp. DT53]|uniref:right-handed parallel beta-helix repeat-containing protein n=1 Tax=Micromonospora sp. DT53 TaxID=3393444 RepID=UPI003CE94C35